MRRILPLLLALVAAAAPRNRLASITVRGDGAVETVRIAAARPLDFTTQKLESPPRVVLDLPEAALGDAPAELAVDDGTIVRVRAAEYGSGAAAVTRLVIELAVDVDFDVAASGTALEVKVPRAALIALAKPRPPDVAEAPSAPAPVVEAKAAPVVEAKPAPVVADAEPGAEAKAVQDARADAELKADESKLAQQAQADAERKAAEAKRADEARADAERKADEAKLADEAKRADEARADAEREADARRRATPPPSLPTVKLLAQSAPPPDEPEPAPAPPPNLPTVKIAPAPARADITGLGFRPSAGGGRLLIHTTRALAYVVRQVSPTELILELPGARIARANDRRPLDTAFFASPVTLISPRVVAGGVRIEITLRGPSRYTAAQEPRLLTLDFE